MPINSSVDRMKKELAAQKARAEALKHLEATGSGPSQRELTHQQQQRQKQTANATSSVAERRVLGVYPPEVSNADKFDPRVRDNTLHAVAVQRAQELQKTTQTEPIKERYRLEPRRIEQNALPPDWQEVVDPTSGDSYYWNQTTNETVWERPCTSSTKTREVKGVEAKTGDGELPEGWEKVPDAASGDSYYWNRKTNETTWTRPVKQNVSLVEAIEAKAKLDKILKRCGNVPAVNSSSSATEKKYCPKSLPMEARSSEPLHSVLLKRPVASAEQLEDNVNKRQKKV